jgi:hypothetical protein
VEGAADDEDEHKALDFTCWSALNSVDEEDDELEALGRD